MTIKRKITLVILVVLGLFMLFALWYKYTYSMDLVQEYEIAVPSSTQQLLIATQGSAFKDAITANIVDHFKERNLSIKVIDVTALSTIDIDDYDAITLLHTWENWEPPLEVAQFINRTKAIRYKIVVLTTSGNGSFKMEDIDAITGESKLEASEQYSNEMIQRLERILNL